VIRYAGIPHLALWIGVRVAVLVAVGVLPGLMRRRRSRTVPVA
jgi:hypothetical protein